MDILLWVAQTLKVSPDWLLYQDIPQTQYAYNMEAAGLIADSAPEETVILLEFMGDLKNGLRKALNNHREHTEAQKTKLTG